MRKFRHFTKNDRLQLSRMLYSESKKIEEIAAELGFAETSVRREIKRGQYEHLNKDWTTENRYSPEIAQERYQENLRAKGPGLKIGKDRKLAEYIENSIIEKQWSPAAVLGHIKREKLEFQTNICVTTLYSYINKNVFLRLTNKELPVRGKKKRKYRKTRVIKRASKGTSIEKRPEHINIREEFGHWEMDTVIGKNGDSKNVLLVLTERKTRKELLLKLLNKETESVRKALNFLERRYGLPLFRKLFKTITVDNGSEFMDTDGFETSYRGGKIKRTKIYYCHPYSSYERGTNEVTNKMVRRKIPKATNFDHMTKTEIQKIEDWINLYPRKLFEYGTAEDAFQRELAVLKT